jgi:hypothetical protein
MHGNITRNSLCSYLYLKLAKMSYSSFSLFSSAKSEGRLNRSCPVGRVGTSKRGKFAGKEDRRMKMMQKLCTHSCKCKNGTCQNCSLN